MTEQSGADYLRRLKADTERPVMSPFQAPAPTSVEADRPAASQNAPERRRSPRYKCEGSAEFRVGGTDVRTWGTLTDLSIHGCYIEMTATFPVGAMVDLVLEIEWPAGEREGRSARELSVPGNRRRLSRCYPRERAHLAVNGRQSLGAAANCLRLTWHRESYPISTPLIANPAAALEAAADFFEGHSSLSKSEFLQLIRKNQTQPR
jgi:hypothetical protein